MPARTPHGTALAQALTDGAWHPRASIVDHIANHVPPGQAVRRTRTIRDRDTATRRRNGITPNPSQSRQQDDRAVGAHDIAMRLIAARVQRGAIEQTTAPDGTVLIRKAP